MFGCVSIFTIVRGFIFIPHVNTILADYGKAQFYLKKIILINKKHCLPNRDRLISKLAQKTLKHLIGTKPCLIPFFYAPSSFSSRYSYLLPIL